jgi:hypothetical protein
VTAPHEQLFELLSDMPNYGGWLLGSNQFGSTTDIEPYPVRLGSRYHDGKPDHPGKDWWGTVTGFQPPGLIDFHHTITVRQLKATVDVHIHNSFEKQNGQTHVSRWLVPDIAMPVACAPSGASSRQASTRRTSGPSPPSSFTLKPTPKPEDRPFARSEWLLCANQQCGPMRSYDRRRYFFTYAVKKSG